jgi:nucleoside-diphosphate-sugar epimerase
MADTCLVTGASGFVGGHLVERLLDDGHRVRCLVRTTSDVSLLERLGVELAYGDLTDAGSVSRAADGCRYVLHCGALVSDWATVDEIRQINVGGTKNVVEACAAASVQRLVHVSTTDVYGYPGTESIEETHPVGRFRNWYAQTKLEAEGEVRRSVQTEYVILRPATVYGPRSDEVVGEIAAAIRRRQMVLIGGGRAIAGLAYVANVADAAALALRAETAAGETFNVTDGLPVTWRQFVDDLADGLGYSRVRWSLPYGAGYGLALLLEQGYRLLRKTTGVRLPPLLSRQAVHVLGRNQDFSSEKAKTQLGWQPRVDYRTGLEATLEWLRVS